MARHRSTQRNSPPVPTSGGTPRRRATGPVAPRHRRPEPRSTRRVVAAAAGGGVLAVIGAAGTVTPTDQVSAVTAAMSVGLVPTTSAAAAPPSPTEQASGLVDGALLARQAVLAQRETLQRLSTQAAELARAQAERARVQHDEADRAAPPSGVAAATPAGCTPPTSGLGPVKSWVRAAAVLLGCRFDVPTMFGVAGRSSASDHPAGLAVDFMVDRATGDRLAACALKNAEALGVKYVIYRQRINTGNGWEAMEDRGSATANHMDHVHISFNSTASPASAIAC